ncbi:MAG: patatin-like phospholipase family protein [Hungatella sp.]
MSYGLALSGGGTRGAAHVGILKALEEADLLPDSIAGTSAGSIAAGLYASGMSISDMCDVIDYLSRHGLFLLDPNYLGLLKFVPQVLIGREVSLTGLLKGNRLLKLLCALTNGVLISDISIPLVIPTVDLNSGNTIAYTNVSDITPQEEVVWQRQGRLCDIMMASSAVPAIFSPRSLGNYDLVDGGVTHNLPVNLLMAAGQKRILAIDIGGKYEMPRSHSITEVVSHSFSIMSKDLKNCRSQGEFLLLKPQLPKGAGLLTFESMNDCLHDGYEYAKREMPMIRQCIERE